MQQFTIPGRLPGLNSIINSSRTHWAVANKQKQEGMCLVAYYARAARIKPVKGYAEITISCFEPNKRRDADNIQAGANKVILDALYKAGIIPGDGQKYIRLITPCIMLDRENPRIEVEIEEDKQND